MSPAWSTPWIIGWAGIVVGFSVFVWGLKFKDRHWWSYLLRKKVAAAVIAPPVQAERWIPLDQAIRYLARRSQWSEHHSPDDPQFSINVSTQIRDALACGDLTARGRYFHVLRGGVAADHPLTPIPQEYWKGVRIEAYWPLVGTPQNIASHRVENVVRNGDHEGMHDVRLEQTHVEALWPPRQSAHPAETKPAVPPPPDTFESLRERTSRVGLEIQEAVSRAVMGNSSLRPPPEPAKLDDRSQAAADRARYEMRRITGGIGDPVAMGARRSGSRLDAETRSA